ncbi:MAG: methyltransferase domain-containing protein [Polyangiales bacterium]
MTNDFDDPARYWNEAAGPKWATAQASVDRMLGPIHDALLAACRVQPGERVIDIGYGGGTTTLGFAQRVGPTGRVLGVDISRPLFEHARSRCSGIDHITLECADAGAFRFERGWGDLMASRFGVMFFPDPVQAFANIREGLRERGRITFACWQVVERNPWITFVLRAFPDAQMPLPPPGDGPGPFSLAEPSRLRQVLEQAGFSEVQLESFETTVELGETVDETLEGMSDVGPFSRLLSEASELDRPAMLARARAFLEREYRNGPPALDAAAWLVRAVNPAG